MRLKKIKPNERKAELQPESIYWIHIFCSVVGTFVSIFGLFLLLRPETRSPLEATPLKPPGGPPLLECLVSCVPFIFNGSPLRAGCAFGPGLIGVWMAEDGGLFKALIPNTPLLGATKQPRKRIIV